MGILRTAESVTEGQADKIADQISDAVVDAIIEQDNSASIGCETLISNGFCIVAGEICTEAYVPIAQIAKNTFREIGYTDGSYGFDYRSAGVIMAVHDRSGEIAGGIRKNGKLGASDESVVIGYACDETPELVPFDTALAHKLTRRLAEVRKSGLLPFLLPDGRAQVTIELERGRVAAIRHISISAQHSRGATLNQVREAVMEEVIEPVVARDLAKNATIEINPAGNFVIGGPQCDTGLTGRKIISDSYGTACAHGGGALSGKDPLRIDRAGAYAARYLAKNIVAAGLAKRAQVDLTYTIGAVEPVAIHISTGFHSGVDDEKLADFVRKNFDLSTEGIAARLNLLQPHYRATAAYGTFGRAGLAWESTDAVTTFKKF
ncbi:S-adenosylmethionine synthase [Campylobacterota bacterium]|nr:S-adenosylmethionine synthase [Campylobacterota bacterium]